MLINCPQAPPALAPDLPRLRSQTGLERHPFQAGLSPPALVAENSTMNHPATSPSTEPSPAPDLDHLARRIDHIDQVVSRLENALANAPALTATLVDAFDDTCRRAARNGHELDTRLTHALALIDRLTAPETALALEALLDRLPQLNSLAAHLDQLPASLATLVDIFDDYAARLDDQGIDLATSLRQGLHAAVWLGQRVSETELERLGILLRSDVLDPSALAVVGKTGTALASTHERAADSHKPDQLGPLGLLKALRDPDVKRSLAFALDVARTFGRSLESAPASPPLPTPPGTRNP